MKSGITTRAILCFALSINAIGMSNTNNVISDTPICSQIEGKLLRAINISLLKWRGHCDADMDDIVVNISHYNGRYYVNFVDKTLKSHGIIQGKCVFMVVLDDKSLEVIKSGIAR